MRDRKEIKMLLRFRGPDGTVRVPVEADESFGELGDKASILCSPAYRHEVLLMSYSLSNSYPRTSIL